MAKSKGLWKGVLKDTEDYLVSSCDWRLASPTCNYVYHEIKSPPIACCQSNLFDEKLSEV
jgi:hypothetical protein